MQYLIGIQDTIMMDYLNENEKSFNLLMVNYVEKKLVMVFGIDICIWIVSGQSSTQC